MKIPTVKYCCCGCSLRTGTLIIAVLGVIFCVIWATISGFGLVGVKYVLDHPEEKSPLLDEMRKVAPALKPLYVSMLVSSVIGLINNCVLLMGTNLNKARLVRIWVIVSMVVFCIHLGLVFILFLFDQDPTHITRILASLVDLYFIVVVNSFYKTLCQDGAVQ